MLYRFVKVIARLAIKFYCRDLRLNKPALLHCDGPLMLASNHPNSFLDAVILCTLFDRPVYSLARGDAFKGKWISRILFALKLLPVYRVSEGVENLEENYKTFDLCKEIFRRNGIVLIFSEGKCINEWHLRPLKKGTARLAISSWLDGIPLKVLPVGINYSSFRLFGKNIHLSLGEYITAEAVHPADNSGRSIQSFNQLLRQQLENFVFEIDKADQQKLWKFFYVPQPLLKKILLFLPSLVGWLLHAPLFYPVKKFVEIKTNSTDHFDSAVVGILMIAYPLYLIFFVLLVLVLTGSWHCLLPFLILPATAWAHLQLKKQID